MKNLFLLLVCIAFSTQILFAQQKDEPEKKGFDKANFFTGGSVSLSFFNGAFLVGGSPVFGYSLTNWADVGVVANYNYTSYSDYFSLNDHLHQSVFGGGFFTRLFPAHFLFAQAQIEHNWVRIKHINPNGSVDPIRMVDANSLLVGGGYTTGRGRYGKSVYGYLAILFDVLKNPNSPYLDNIQRSIPLIRAGINVPLFQGKR